MGSGQAAPPDRPRTCFGTHLNPFRAIRPPCRTRCSSRCTWSKPASWRSPWRGSGTNRSWTDSRRPAPTRRRSSGIRKDHRLPRRHQPEPAAIGADREPPCGSKAPSHPGVEVAFGARDARSHRQAAGQTRLRRRRGAGVRLRRGSSTVAAGRSARATRALCAETRMRREGPEPERGCTGRLAKRRAVPTGTAVPHIRASGRDHLYRGGRPRRPHLHHPPREATDLRGGSARAPG